ncbi:MAG: SusC/RagA family TonB-linked outer membrane protein [Niastella sp.]|uniref:SusC/RagA family TonB-linked outer membrane protein n=1 Tax=Niastella sp. TaxID=1869183 RepID=UPI00389A9223
MTQKPSIIRWSNVFVLYLLLMVGCYQAAAQTENRSLQRIELAKFIDRLSGEMHWKLLYNPDDLANKFVDTASPGTITRWTINRLSTLLKKYDLRLQPVGENTYAIKKGSPPQVQTTIPDTTGREIKNEIIVRGTIRTDSATLEGATISLKSDPTRAVTSDQNGRYLVKAPANGTLIITSVGYKEEEIDIKGESVINVKLKSANNSLEEVAVVAYGTQKKTTMVGAVTTINPKELKGPVSNLTTMLAGRLSGVISYQRSGEPGKDNASFFIRGITTFGTGKVDPLILIDGIESSSTDLARLQPDDISGFSILKDATASSLYGARGANGVVLVTTKSGADGRTRFNIRAENSLSSNTRNYRFADNVSYMKLANEAVSTRNALENVPYSQSKIDHTAAGDDPYLYPSNNWLKRLIKDYTNNQRFDMNVSGGNKLAQYYIAGTYNIDNGVLKVDKINNFNSNIKLKSYSIRSNVTFNFTPTTQAIVRTYGQFNDYKGPVGGGDTIFKQAVWANPVKFAPVYPAGYAPGLTHPLFGNAFRSDVINPFPGNGSNLYNNPYANMMSGYQQYNSSTLQAQLELKQDLAFITPGLAARLMAYTQRYSYFDVTRQYTPFYYQLSYDLQTKVPRLTPLNTNGTEYLNYSEGPKTVNTTSYLEAAVNYNRQIGQKHNVSGMLITLFRNYLAANAGSLQLSLPHRNHGVSGRFTYAYDNRYMAEFNFGYNGSERFAQNHRFGFFPSVGLAWNVSNEKFFEPLSFISKLKLRATYGLVGNDQIGADWERFFYLSDVNMNNGNRSYGFGEMYNNTSNGISVNRYENYDITWERSYKTNVGIELGLWNSLNILVDVYRERRSNILMTRGTIPSMMGLSAPIQANVGEAEGKGVDLSADYTYNLGKHTWLQARGTFTYATSKLLVNEEPAYPEAYRRRVGQPLSQTYGFIAERLFIDDYEVNNAPVQNFGQDNLAENGKYRVRGGDIKYRDVNHDGQITDADMVPIGLPTTPEITYGFGLSFGYKKWDVSCYFQGSARSSFMIESYKMAPFVLDGGGQHGLLAAIADDYWGENNRNPYAFWPRLSNYYAANNIQTSTWWMRRGDFLRMKTAEVGYTFPKSLLSKLHFSNTRIYANAFNLFVISRFNMWDPEMGGNGLGYPVQRVYNVGVNLGF